MSDVFRTLYPFLSETETTADPEPVLREVSASTRLKSREIVDLRRATFAEATDAIVDAAIAMADAFARGRKLLAFGNGGSATDAQDAAADCARPPVAGWRSLPAIALVDAIATVTAIANDVGFENVFARQVIALGDAGDIAIAFSTSGRSPSVLAGLAEAKRRGLITIGLAGYDGGSIRTACDHAIVVRAEHIPRIQEAQATAWHALLELTQIRLCDS
ncbi:MAG TPA: SIS domain-containing protein [Gemmatimonadaceae bacterium]|nr:SIS domain-containing protein [Gemmatimonadaceae bacterium]